MVPESDAEIANIMQFYSLVTTHSLPVNVAVHMAFANINLGFMSL